MLPLLSVNNRYTCLLRANIRYGKNGEGREIFLIKEGNFLNGGGEAVCPLCRGRARIPTTSNGKFCVSIVNSWKP